MRQSLAIVGASTRSAAASAVRAGFQPLAADLFADADLRHIATATRISPFPDGFVDWLRATEPPAWMYTGAMENHPDLIDQMAWVAPLWGNPGEVLNAVRSPWQLERTLREAGLLFPAIRSAADGTPTNGSWLTKTYEGASGSGVRESNPSVKTTNASSPTTSAGEGPLAQSSSPNFVYQERISGTPCAAVFVASEGHAMLLGVTRQLIGEQWLGSHRFQYSGSIGPWPVSEIAKSTIAELGNVISERFELIGLFGVDFILRGDEVWTLEVNPRFTASVEIAERFSGISAIALHAAACTGSAPNVERPSLAVPAAAPPACGKAILYAKRHMVMTQQFAEHALEQAMATPWPTMADISPAATPIEAGRPILTFFADGENVDDVERRMHDRATEIERMAYQD